MNPSLVSIIVATKNDEKNLKRCLVSCQKQTYKKIEIIVVDNFSEDKTAEIAKKYTKKLFLKGPERSMQRNFGAQKAKGEFLLFLDADMELASNLVKDCLFQKTNAVSIPEKVPHVDFWTKCRDFEKSLYEGDNLFSAPRFIKKSLFVKLKGYSKNLYAAEDWDLLKRLQNNRVKPANSQSFLIHNEGPISLKKLMKKKFYYGLNLKHYVKKHPKSSLSYILRTPFFKNYKKIILNPSLSIGMFTLKTLEYLSTASGFIWGYFR